MKRINVKWFDEKRGCMRNGFVEFEEITDPELALIADYKLVVYENSFGAVVYSMNCSIEAVKSIQQEIINSNYNITWLIEMR